SRAEAVLGRKDVRMPSLSSRRSGACSSLAGLTPRRLWSRDDGQSTVEFAMVLPLFAALVLAFLGLGKAVYYYLGVTHLAEEGARLAVVSATIMPDGTPATSASLAQYLCKRITTSDTAVDKAKVGVTYGGTGGSSTAGNPVTVSVTTK